MRHPLYFGGMLGLWSTPTMTVTHLAFAVSLSTYFIIGTSFEEKDLRQKFGDLYKHYASITPRYIPFIKKPRAKKVYLKGMNKLEERTL